MVRSKKSEMITQLKQDGFKMVTGYAYLYINSQGKVYNLKTGRYIKPTAKNLIITKNITLNVAKLVLQVFAKEPYKTGHVQYLDGNKQNLSVNNLKYKRIYTKDQSNPINQKDLLRAIRCYFKVKPRYTLNDKYLTVFYLKAITDVRKFVLLNSEKSEIKIFDKYLSLGSISKTAKDHNLSVRDTTCIINKFLNILIIEILSDKDNGLLTVLPYSPKPLTKTQQLKRLNETLAKKGLQPMPLRNKSKKEMLKHFLKKLNDLFN